LHVLVNAQSKVSFTTCHEGTDGVGRVIAIPFFNLGAKGGGWSVPSPGRFTPWEEPLYPLQGRMVGFVVGMYGAENLAIFGVHSPNLPTRIESLY